MKNEGKNEEEEKKEIIKIHCWEGFVEVLRYGDKSVPSYRMGRICKIVGKDSFAFWGRIYGKG